MDAWKQNRYVYARQSRQRSVRNLTLCGIDAFRFVLQQQISRNRAIIRLTQVPFIYSASLLLAHISICLFLL